MVLQNAGLITIISTSVLSFVNSGGATESLRRLGVLIVGLIVLWLLAKSQWIEPWLDRGIKLALERWTDLNVLDYYSLLKVELCGKLTHISFYQGQTSSEAAPLHHCRTGAGFLPCDSKKAGRTMHQEPFSEIRMNTGFPAHPFSKLLISIDLQAAPSRTASRTGLSLLLSY